MVFSVSTLFLAALVFNAASTLGAPLRFPDTSSSVVARTESVVPPVAVVAREEVQPIVRRYPRRALHERYEKREPVPEPGTTIKKVTISQTETISHDTPEDAAAYAKANPGDAAKGSSTVISFVQTLSIPSAPTATASATSSVDPNATPSAASSAVTGSASATGTASSSAGVPTATAASSSSAAAPSATDAAAPSASATDAAATSSATATSTDVPANATPTAAPSDTATPPAGGPVPAADGQAPPASASATGAAPASPSADASPAPAPAPQAEKRATAEVSGPAPVNSGSGVSRPAGNGIDSSGRRAGSGISGAAMASALRRALEETFKL